MAKNKKRVYLLVGTKKGAFVLSSDFRRKEWTLKGPLLKGAEVNDIIMDTRTTPTMFAAVNSYWWGSNVHISKDMGKTWVQSEGGVKFDPQTGKTVAKAWCVRPGVSAEPDVLYAGVDPGALFVSRDRGVHWTEVKALTSHPTREKWTPGGGGMMVHSISVHPTEGSKIFVGISAAGVFATGDGGASWEARNKGVLAEFLPDKFPEVGQCVHHLELHPETPSVLYQQNHCGVYRSDNEGKEWVDISGGLPSRFGFPIQIHPNDPDTVFVIPEEGAEFRCTPNGEFAVYRSRNKGERWKKMGKGLPKKNAYLHVLRQAMKMDVCDPAGLYVGTSSGQIFFSKDDGKSWTLLIDYLPSIYSVNTAIA